MLLFSIAACVSIAKDEVGDEVLGGFAEKEIDSDVVVANNAEGNVGEINEICVGDKEEGSRGR